MYGDGSSGIGNDESSGAPGDPGVNDPGVGTPGDPGVDDPEDDGADKESIEKFRDGLANWFAILKSDHSEDALDFGVAVGSASRAFNRI